MQYCLYYLRVFKCFHILLQAEVAVTGGEVEAVGLVEEAEMGAEGGGAVVVEVEGVAEVAEVSANLASRGEPR